MPHRPLLLNLTPKWLFPWWPGYLVQGFLSLARFCPTTGDVIPAVCQVWSRAFFLIGCWWEKRAICVLWPRWVTIFASVCLCVCVFEDILVQCACYRESYVAPSVAKEWCSNMMLNRVQAKAKAQRKVERKSVTLCWVIVASCILLPTVHPSLSPFLIHPSIPPHPLPQPLSLAHLFFFSPSLNLPLMCPWQCGKLF